MCCRQSCTQGIRHVSLLSCLRCERGAAARKCFLCACVLLRKVGSTGLVYADWGGVAWDAQVAALDHPGVMSGRAFCSH